MLRTLIVALAVLAARRGAAAPGPAAIAPRVDRHPAGALEFEGTSAFSRVRVRRQGSVRSLLFVRDTGEEALESQLDLRRPQVLRFPYLRYLFASYLVEPQPRRVLIVGLGGGGMIRFLEKVDPQVQVDAVEIDPLVIEVADKFFGVRSSEHVAIHEADGLKFIAEAPPGRYDAAYLDAFLKPSAETDATGAPLALRTAQFYAQLRACLTPGGTAAFNLNPHEGLADDVREIAAAFPTTLRFALPNGQGAVVVATAASGTWDRSALALRARELDRSGRFQGLLNFRQMTASLQPPSAP